MGVLGQMYMLYIMCSSILIVCYLLRTPGIYCEWLYKHKKNSLVADAESIRFGIQCFSSDY